MMKGCEIFSTGNHPVEMLLPSYHLDAAGFEIEVATISDDLVKFEWWAFPNKDEAVKATYEKYEKQLNGHTSDNTRINQRLQKRA